MGDLNKYFNRSEFLCKGKNCHPSGKGNCGFDTVDADLLSLVTMVREYFNNPVTVTSGCRCAAYNERVGGVPSSQHKLGRAADIIVRGVEPDDVAEFLESMCEAPGVGRYSTFTHVDSRTGKAWWCGQ